MYGEPESGLTLDLNVVMRTEMMMKMRMKMLMTT